MKEPDCKVHVIDEQEAHFVTAGEVNKCFFLMRTVIRNLKLPDFQLQRAKPRASKGIQPVGKLGNPFGRFGEIDSVVLFGSRAMGNYKQGSDIDIALMGPEATPDTASRLQLLLNEELPIPYFFDVVAFNHLEHEGMRNHINEVGVTIYKQAARVK